MSAPADAGPTDEDRPSPAVTPSPTPTSARERRTIVVAGAAFFGVLGVLIVLAAVVAGDSGDPQPTATTQACAPDDAQCLAAQQSAGRPGIIPRPGEGQAPEEPGDPGGWEQTALFGVLVGGLALIVVLVVRGARRARARPRTNAPS
ncbi:hypothetical protein PO878_00555 [Iamia majanohamensis]|uniref:Uncharacterized protein n=1 Tax=Iamia majanohamensis TaxID=467976 RepID=A0AAE9YG68_9ACTN|nr:hypothetical protein [Iamia majanohamensis]WCO67211.1 hypothetical protein PO878_00555 [Iamia majanohamensis]